MQKGLCKHYNGSFHNKTCDAGICYNAVTPAPKEPGCALRRPCRTIPVFDSPSQLEEFAKRGTCEKYQEPTEAEIAEYEAKVQSIVRNFEASLPLIGRVKKEHHGQDWQGVEECPICKGKLHIRHANYNGHTHGKCETADCLNWME